MLWGLIFLFFYKENRISYQIMFYVFVVLYLGLDGWIYHQLFKNKGICMHEKEYPKVEDVIEAIHQDQPDAVCYP